MATLTPQRKHASQTTGGTRRNLYQVFQRAVHCTSSSQTTHDSRLNNLLDSVTAVGGTIHVPEVAVDFSGGGFSNFVSIFLFMVIRVFTYMALSSLDLPIKMTP